ncbi:MAG: nitroreductase family protein [Eubacterium sp.]|nr:nitroreductase family protein [Eubacterium sp.]
MSKHNIIVDNSLCIGCSLCDKDCPDSNFDIKNGKAHIRSNDCLMCGHCVAVCPKGAVSISGFSDCVEEIPEINASGDDVYNLIRFRRSVRQFSEEKVPQDIIDKIVEVGRVSRTAANSQNVGIRVMTENIDRAEEIAVKFFRNGKKLGEPFKPSLKKKEIKKNFFFFGAPLVIVVLSKSGFPFADVNATLSASDMETVAQGYGLGVLHSGFFTICANLIPGLRKMLKIPRGKKAVTTLVIGYPRVKYYRSVNRENGDIDYV